MFTKVGNRVAHGVEDITRAGMSVLANDIVKWRFAKQFPPGIAGLPDPVRAEQNNLSL